MNKFDVSIIGAGPAGISCALKLAKGNPDISIAIFDKDDFPREKVCGDGLSFDTIRQLSKNFPEVVENLRFSDKVLPSNGIRIFSPTGRMLEIPFGKDLYMNGGLIIKREAFDNIYFQELLEYPNIKIFLSTKIKDYTIEDDLITLISDKAIYNSKITVGADGPGSIFAKSINAHDNKKNIMAIRAYYKNVKTDSSENFIELHYLKELLPAYFWIFPEKDNIFNVGLGIIPAVSKRKDIKNLFYEIINNSKHISPRFINAEEISVLKGGVIPICTNKKTISGNRYLLTGDAAGMVDPASGEGVGNAIRTGLLAAEHIRNAINANDFSATFNKNFDQKVYSKMYREFRMNYFIQRLSRSAGFVNFILYLSRNNSMVKSLLIRSLQDSGFKKNVGKYL